MFILPSTSGNLEYRSSIYENSELKVFKYMKSLEKISNN